MTDKATLILLALSDGAAHGYGIKQRVLERTAGAVRLGSGTLYEAVQRLQRSGKIEEVPKPHDQPSAGGPPRRFYGLTEAGRDALCHELQQMDVIVQFAKERELLANQE